VETIEPKATMYPSYRRSNGSSAKLIRELHPDRMNPAHPDATDAA
jgi:hypothetical protein